jgi:putative transposase
MTLAALDEAVAAGARLERACEVVGLDTRTVQRWRARGHAGGDDLRQGPTTRPGNALTEAEQAEILAISHREEFRDVTPKTIVPTLADRGEYIASESSFYRVLRRAGEMAHRGRARPSTPRPVSTYAMSDPHGCRRLVRS